MERIAESFEDRHGIQIVRNYGGSGALLAQASLSQCDFYLPADQSYLSMELAQDLIQKHRTLFSMSAVFVCRAEDHRWEGKRAKEILTEVRKMSLGDRSTAIGAYAEALFKEQQLWSQNVEQKMIRKPSVISALNDVTLEVADVTMAWRPLVSNRKDLKILDEARLNGKPVAVSLAKMTSIQHEESARLFEEYIEREGRTIFTQYGFETD